MQHSGRYFQFAMFSKGFLCNIVLSVMFDWSEQYSNNIVARAKCSVTIGWHTLYFDFITSVNVPEPILTFSFHRCPGQLLNHDIAVLCSVSPVATHCASVVLSCVPVAFYMPAPICLNSFALSSGPAVVHRRVIVTWLLIRQLMACACLSHCGPA